MSIGAEARSFMASATVAHAVAIGALDAGASRCGARAARGPSPGDRVAGPPTGMTALCRVH